jgi:hypothetical protein
MNMFEFLIASVEAFPTFVDHSIESKIMYQIRKRVTGIGKVLDQLTPDQTIFYDQLTDFCVEVSKKQAGRDYLLKGQEDFLNTLVAFGDPSQLNFEKSTLFFSLVSFMTNLMYSEEANPMVTPFKLRWWEICRDWLFGFLKKQSTSRKPGWERKTAGLLSNMTNLTTNSRIRKEMIDVLCKNPAENGLIFAVLGTHALKASKHAGFNETLLENLVNLITNLLYDTSTNPGVILIFQAPEFQVFLGKMILSSHQNVADDTFSRVLTVVSKVMHPTFPKIPELLTFLATRYPQSPHFSPKNDWVKALISLAAVAPLDSLKSLATSTSSFVLTITNTINTTEFVELALLNNSILLVSNLVTKDIAFAQPFRSILERLVFILKEKTGPLRKTAAITLAKMSQDKAVLERCRELHATELLINLQTLI